MLEFLMQVALEASDKAKVQALESIQQLQQQLCVEAGCHMCSHDTFWKVLSERWVCSTNLQSVCDDVAEFMTGQSHWLPNMGLEL